MHACMLACMHAYMHANMLACMQACMHACIYSYMVRLSGLTGPPPSPQWYGLRSGAELTAIQIIKNQTNPLNGSCNKWQQIPGTSMPELLLTISKTFFRLNTP